MRVLVVGAGGREHALVWALASSAEVRALYCVPGSDAIAGYARVKAIDPTDSYAVIAFARQEAIDLVVIGPEAPLVAGVTDALEAAGIAVFGPSGAAARLEASKTFTKALCDRHAIPTAAYKAFESGASDAAKAYVDEQGAPIVIKADGLAAGKGVVVVQNVAEAYAAIDAAFAGRFGEAGARVVIEECLVGEEASLFVLSDGENIALFGTAQDHKRAFDGDEGPNTGGMGAYSPAPIMTPEMTERAMAEIIRPTVAGMAEAGTPFKGVLYAGLMITADGPKLIEYNVRFGDPECQVLMPRLKSDLATVLAAAARGGLAEASVEWFDDVHAMTVVLAAKGYPGDHAKGEPISGIERAEASSPDVTVFHAGTRRSDSGWLSNGGRVLNVTARGATLKQARDTCYRAIEALDWPGGFCRYDIGWRVLGSAWQPTPKPAPLPEEPDQASPATQPATTEPSQQGVPVPAQGSAVTTTGAGAMVGSAGMAEPADDPDKARLVFDERGEVRGVRLRQSFRFSDVPWYQTHVSFDELPEGFEIEVGPDLIEQAIARGLPPPPMDFIEPDFAEQRLSPEEILQFRMEFEREKKKTMRRWAEAYEKYFADARSYIDEHVETEDRAAYEYFRERREALIKELEEDPDGETRHKRMCELLMLDPTQPHRHEVKYRKRVEAHEQRRAEEAALRTPGRRLMDLHNPDMGQDDAEVADDDVAPRQDDDSQA